MSQAPRTLDAGYRAHAIPRGSPRFWSWQFAHEGARAPLLGIYALLAEWSALMDPATEYGAAYAKLSWWQDEVRRLAAGKPVHPIGAYLASLPGAAAVDFGSLSLTIDAAVEEAGGAPLERSRDLEPHAQALRGNPLILASRLAGAHEAPSLAECTQALAVAEYLARSVTGYKREARFGRVPFVVEELAANGIDNADLSAENAPARLDHFLRQLRERALLQFDAAARALRAPERSAQRHLLVLAALGRRRLQQNSSARQPRGLQDMLLAWNTARGATRSLSE
jgi:15-cis-phytoene synthase